MSKKEYAKCKKCGHFFAAELVKDNLCPDCQEKPEQQKIYTIEELEKLIGTPEERVLMPDGSTEPKYKQVKPEPSGEFVDKLYWAEKRIERDRSRIEQLEEKSAFAVRRIKRDRVRIEQLTERIEELEAEKGVTDGKPKIH